MAPRFTTVFSLSLSDTQCVLRARFARAGSGAGVRGGGQLRGFGPEGLQTPIPPFGRPRTKACRARTARLGRVSVPSRAWKSLWRGGGGGGGGGGEGGEGGGDSFLTSVGDNSGHEGEEEREEEQAETKANATAEQANGVLDETDVHGGRETHLHDLHVGLGLVLDKV